MNNENDLIKALEISKTKVDNSLKSSQKCFDKESMEEYSKLYSEQLSCERNLAKFRNEEYAIPIDFPLQWDTGVPLPFVFSNENKTILTFYLQQVDPDWDNTYISDSSEENIEQIALVEFELCYSFKFGSPNDEVHEGHPLYGKGLDSYTAQIIINSIWIKNIEKINSVHIQYEPKNWDDLNHYVFWFHDTTYECIAKSYKTEVFQTSMKKLLTVINERLLK
ncbi:MAG: hypothetical protein GY760_07405 [Deltaproteobacteria bacterium]|nr:hypothetical protein [Deltaproteobacteria bacterium]